jgi:hypothetical protein
LSLLVTPEPTFADFIMLVAPLYKADTVATLLSVDTVIPGPGDTDVSALPVIVKILLVAS